MNVKSKLLMKKSRIASAIPSSIATSTTRERRASLPASRIQITDFELIKKIGQGGFGEVYLCRKKDTNEILALKIMEKSVIWTKNKKRQVKNERDVLAQGSHEHLVRLYYSFQDSNYLYLAMEYCPGGDLYHLVENLNRLEEDDARLYIAEMVAAIHSLHNLGYIHRDLKPDNFLIDSKGHIKLADFGLSKEGLGQYTKEESPPTVTNKKASGATKRPTHKRRAVHSVVGSPDYMAPEILSSSSNGYGKEVDWWSLGALLFEIVSGETPFSADTPQEVFENIINWRVTLPDAIDRYRGVMSDVFLDLLLGFLCEPEKRLGSNIDAIKKHPFFKGIDWDNLRTHVPLFIPKLDNEYDVSYFNVPPTPDGSNPQQLSVPLTPLTSFKRYYNTCLLTHTEKLSNPLKVQLERLHRSRSLDSSDFRLRGLASPRVTPFKSSNKEEQKPVAGGTERSVRPLILVTPTKDPPSTPPSDKQILGFTFQRKQTSRVVHLDKKQVPTFRLLPEEEEQEEEVEEKEVEDEGEQRE